MAIDTTKKLVSAIWKSLPIPDADIIDNYDMSWASYHYAGITFEEGIPIADIIRAVNISLVVSGDTENISLVVSGDTVNITLKG